MFEFDADMGRRGWRKYSQNDEDGVLEYIFSVIPPGPQGRFFVEMGVGPPWNSTLEESGLEANCRLLKEKGWRGLSLDAQAYAEEYEVKQERIDPINVNPILRKYGAPESVDLISIDVDGQDFWVWSNLVYFPSVVVIEYNASLGMNESKVIPFNAFYQWDGTNWFGASLRALNNLAMSKGYVLTYANGVNAFFIRDSLVKNKQDFCFEKLYRFRDLHRADALNRMWVLIPEAPSADG
jgi:hypothetical protein